MDASYNDLTYGEYTKRRNSLLGKINRLRGEYKRATDPRYTALVENPGQYALAELSATEIELGQLIAEWERIQKGRNVVG